MPTRRQFLFKSAAAASALASVVVSKRAFASVATAGISTGDTADLAPPPVITVYKDPSCGCCDKWCKHLASNGFVVQPQDTKDVDAIKKQMYVPDKLQSCHTALVGRYVVEGHVPADLIKKMIKEQPQFLGLAVPGMVNGSPGMEGDTKDKYDVVSFDRTGKTGVYASR
jgi:hypothetical protein